MDHKDRQELKRLFNQIGVYKDKIQGIIERYQKEVENNSDSYEERLIVESLQEASSSLYDCYNIMETVIDEI